MDKNTDRILYFVEKNMKDRQKRLDQHSHEGLDKCQNKKCRVPSLELLNRVQNKETRLDLKRIARKIQA
jgi:hypothetical protein